MKTTGMLTNCVVTARLSQTPQREKKMKKGAQCVRLNNSQLTLTMMQACAPDAAKIVRSQSDQGVIFYDKNLTQKTRNSRKRNEEYVRAIECV